MLLVAPVLVSAFAFGGRVLAPESALPAARSPVFAPASRAIAPSMGFANNKLNTMNKMRTVSREKPKARPARLPPDMVEVTNNFRKQYERRDLEILWGALLKVRLCTRAPWSALRNPPACLRLTPPPSATVCKVYGNKERASQAVLENPQILNPSYTFCNTMLASRDVLFDMMGKDEAMEIMLKNPAVLQRARRSRPLCTLTTPTSPMNGRCCSAVRLSTRLAPTRYEASPTCATSSTASRSR